MLEPDSDTDVHTQRTETRAVFNRGQHEVAKRIAEIEAPLPFAILGFDTDKMCRATLFGWNGTGLMSR